MTEEDKKTARLVAMANKFYIEAESPDLETMETLFFRLATRNEDRIRDILEGWEVTAPDEDIEYMEIK